MHSRGIALLDACIEGDMRKIRKLFPLVGGHRGKYGESPLHLACRYGRVRAARFLVENGAVACERKKCGCTPMHAAADGGSAALCELLASHGADVDDHDCKGNAPLHRFAIEGNVEGVAAAVRCGATVDLPTRGEEGGGFTALHLAAMHDHAEVCSALLAAGAEREALRSGGGEGGRGWTPLHAACQGKADGKIEGRAAARLLREGARADAEEVDGRLPLHVAAAFMADGEGAVRVLRAFPQAAERREGKGLTPLHVAAAFGKELLCREIVALRPEALEEASGTGKTPLDYAAEAGSVAIVRALLELGAEGCGGALVHAARGGHVAACKALLDGRGVTPVDIERAAEVAQGAARRVLRKCR